MGLGDSKLKRDQEEQEHFDEVFVSDDVVRRFRGTLLPRFYPNSKGDPQRTPSATHQSQTSLDEPGKDVNKENEALQSLLKETELKTQRLKADLVWSKNRVETLRDRVDQLQNNSILSLSVSALDFQETKSEQGVQQSVYYSDYYRKKLDELRAIEDEIRIQKSKELRENVDRLQKRLVEKEVFKDGNVCAEESGRLFKCYLENRKNSLKCRSLGMEFSRCVDEYRSRLRVPEKS